MKKLLSYLALGASMVLAACQKDNLAPGYDLKPNIYFDWSDSTGTDASRVDSVSFSFALMPDRVVDTVFLPIRISGDRAKTDRFFKLAVVDTASTAKVGLHYKALESQYTMPADSGLVHVPVIFYAQDTSLASKQYKLRIQLVPSTDFTVTDSAYNVTKISFSGMLLQPTWWTDWGALGEYSRVRFELLILSTNTTFMYSKNDFDHATAMQFICSTYNNFLGDPFTFVTNHPKLGLVLDANPDGTYSLYSSGNPAKKWTLYPEQGAYYFHDENGLAIKHT